MNNFFKKAAALSLSCICAAGLMTGCGKEKTAEAPTIHWYMMKPIDTMAHQDEIEKLANDMIQKEVNAKLKLHLLDNAAWADRMNLMISSGEEFDICFTSSWSNKFIDNARKGAFADISDLLKTDGQDILAKEDSRVWDAVTLDGKIYAIPGQGPYSSADALVFKKELVDKYNFDYKSVEKISDLEPFCAQIKANEPGITPILQIAGGRIATGKVDLNYTDDSIPGLDFSESEQKFVSVYDIPEKIETWKTISDFYKKGYIPADAATRNEYMSDAKTGKYAVLKTMGDFTEDGEKSSSSYGFPCVETYMGNSPITNGTVTSSMVAISATSKHPKEAMQVLNLIWKNSDLSNLLAYGIEGVDYRVDNERSTPESKSIIPNSGKDQKWAIWHNFLGPLWDQWDSSWNRKERLEEMQKINKEAEVGSTLGFYFDSANVSAEYAAVSSTIGKINTNLNVGCVEDVDKYLEEARATLKQNGIDKLIEEANRQYSEWKAKK